MKWTIQQINAQKHRGFTFDETLDLSELKEQDPQIRAVSPVRVKGQALFSGDVITFPVEIQGTLTLPCSRTLTDVELPFDMQVSERFVVNNSWMTSEDSNDEIHVVEGDVIDLLPYIKENILLQIPLQIFSDTDEENAEAPPVGNGWEIVTEEEQKDKIDPRLADLGKFFGK
ncbi:YceD family protein [Bacillus sp. FJAT-45350]|uniref:YceD family protein n=1 Tax=Bacillus sp. FJAT-45350 TaxID=2011014 RepID=UPI000BB9B4F7|nr:DUF177 domain-containing protein [Bacillus sp. FJAT-45350]